MKLLLDQNISRRVAESLRSPAVEIRHVSSFGLGSSTDRQIWDFARQNGFAIVSKDADFHHMSFTVGAPPKMIWLRLGNCSTTQIVRCIRANFSAVADFIEDHDSAMMVIAPDSIETL